MSAGTRKHGRNKKRPSQLRYVASGRCAKNKAAKIAKHKKTMEEKRVHRLNWQTDNSVRIAATKQAKRAIRIKRRDDRIAAMQRDRDSLRQALGIRD